MPSETPINTTNKQTRTITIEAATIKAVTTAEQKHESNTNNKRIDHSNNQYTTSDNIRALYTAKATIILSNYSNKHNNKSKSIYW